MKLSENYLPKQVYDEYFLFPTGQALEEGKSVLKINETGFFVANSLLEETEYKDLLAKFMEKYEILNTKIEEVEYTKSIITEYIDILKLYNVLVFS